MPEKNQIREINLDPEALDLLNKRRDVKSNTVTTSRYTWWSFLPHNLFLQFATKMANMYFLVIMGL